jgi:imidazolonepropionase-like amidohydrolase
MMARQWAVLLVALALLVGTQIPAFGQTLVLEGGTLIDGTGRPPVNDAVIVIAGSRILGIGMKGKVAYPPGARVVSTEGKTILPGLIDSHIHLRDHMPPMFLHYGVTTVADTNNYTDWTVAQREAVKSGKIKGPRLFVSGTAIDGAAGNPNSTSPRQPFGAYSHTSSDGSTSPSVALESVAETRTYVRSLAGKHVDMVKTDLDLTFDQLRAAIDEANKLHLPLVGHTQNIRQAAEAGHKYMEHTDTLGRAVLDQMGGPAKVKEGGANPERLMDTSLFPALVQFMVKQGVFVNPTMFARWRTSTPRGEEWAKAATDLIKDPNLAFVPQTIRDSWPRLARRDQDAEGYKKTTEFLRQYAQGGGKIIAGTDAGAMPGLSLHYEMQMLVDAGIPPMKVLQAATLWGAESFGQGKELGSVEVGKLADITIIEGDPLKDIAMTKNIRMVIKDGKVIDISYDPHWVNSLPRPTSGF